MSVTRAVVKLGDLHHHKSAQGAVAMSLFNRILISALGLFLMSSGITKFTSGHVFQYIEFQSGLDLFYPYVNHLTGVGEILAGAFVLFRPTRLVGAALATGLMAGAIGFHLSPWLGVSMPSGLTADAMAPWTAADFTAATTSLTFFLAILTGSRSAKILRDEVRIRRARSLAAHRIASAGHNHVVA
ncbi:MAG: putative membrane protein YphA (DoxX/SURF4 family) [Ilumatobacter sp.]|jgi:uncharacterized membrane protein YphA (DoxX/SURF4 family)